jgi:succinylarginine dihydrolase
LRAIFSDEKRFSHHAPVPAQPQFGDEGAANHMRLCANHGTAGVEIFAYGRSGFVHSEQGPRKFPARQTREASEAIVRFHQLRPECAAFVRQNPAAIDAGAFHNDVVAVANENVLLYHADAFERPVIFVPTLREMFGKCGWGELFLIEVPAADVSLQDAISSYMFNSQLVTLPSGGMALICPSESSETRSTQEFLDRLPTQGTPIRSIHFVDVRQSMNNGGGPACLRLRVVLTDKEIAATASGVFLTDALYTALRKWVMRHYRDHLHPDDLSDAKLIDEGRQALDELTQLLGLGSIYGFQRLSS